MTLYLDTPVVYECKPVRNPIYSIFKVEKPKKVKKPVLKEIEYDLTKWQTTYTFEVEC